MPLAVPKGVDERSGGDHTKHQAGIVPFISLTFLDSTIFFHNSFIVLVSLFPYYKPVRTLQLPRPIYRLLILCSPNAPASLV